MTNVDLHEQGDWPQPGALAVERDPALAALEEAWRSGLLVEHEPSA